MSSTSAIWTVPVREDALVRALSVQLGISPLTAQVLINRGLRDVAAARSFLRPQMSDLADPDSLPGISAAVERIAAAAANKEKVLVYGDYDVDGTASTALLVRFLRLAGIDADYYVPRRVGEGYGLNREAISQFKERGIRLIITVDCGVSAVDECQFAMDSGIDVVVTDHHEPGDQVASACAVVNPKLTGSLHRFRDLSGVGVAFKLAWAVAKQFSPGQKMAPEFREFLLDSLGLVALGTVADIVPLLGENRVLAKYGLRAIGKAAGPGLRALMHSARIETDRLGAVDVAFGLGPRLNAAGRMADATLAIELLMSEDEAQAHRIAQSLEQHNLDRRRVQDNILRRAREMLTGDADPATRRTIVLEQDGWHPGVIGVVASKLLDELARPVALIALDGAVGRGSARSVHGYHLFNVLDDFRSHMLSFGGHASAAGFEIEKGMIPALREHMEKAALALDPDIFRPAVEVDAEVRLDDLSPAVVHELELLAPYGEGNPPPLFVARDLRIVGEPKLMGMRGQHIAFYVKEGKTSLRALGFWRGEALYEQVAGGARTCSIVFSPHIDTWNGAGSVELRIKDIRFK